MQQSNKVALSFYSPSKFSFTLGKLRFLGLRRPKISTCYTTSQIKGRLTEC